MCLSPDTNPKQAIMMQFPSCPKSYINKSKCFYVQLDSTVMSPPCYYNCLMSWSQFTN